MSRQVRRTSKAVRQERRVRQRLLRQARPLTPGEIAVVRHLLQLVIEQRHYSHEVYTYYGRPSFVERFTACRFTGRQRTLSAELARRAQGWMQQLATLRVYHTVCRICQDPYADYVRYFYPVGDEGWPPGVTLHVAFDPTAAAYPVVRREVGRVVHDPHVIVSDDLERVQAVLIL
jgi:hypothetical protein